MADVSGVAFAVHLRRLQNSMRYSLPLLFALIGVGSAHAMDVTTQSLVASSYVTSKVTSAPFDRKLVIQARDDAAAFVATDGQIRGARLQAALDSLRHAHAYHCVGDRELAEAILVQ
ncbi:Protein of uncharacterised function (DUF2388) [Pseudomonas putida]|uniref:Holliday junction resolvase n=2 Tax=Pseudomonas TaxID=286 RepID=A0A6S5TMA6_PSEPU|nr:Protein of uncharacterised function (DUF2388) [Pseudomonas putida]CAB5552078.1 Protein of uncharacterised function (DUF2388) [Pseudomonas putida]CAB5597016.1 Protein of uncharacterised function (DUF2388) [Pseudomonas putida]CAB5606299.1 Protein of uncharacterised function (DUF2388) [Pseudomonas putida]CAB5687981.1 Protein of uncharacterised function (DUF2388) [Pseudomonas putida]